MQRKYVANKAVIVNEEGHILLVADAGKGDHANAKGKTDFPGGRMDKGETPQEGLLRELKEELGVEPSQISIESIFHIGLWGVGGDVENDPIVGIFYIVKPVGELTIALSEEHTDYLWFDPAQDFLDSMPTGVRDTIAAYREFIRM